MQPFWETTGILSISGRLWRSGGLRLAWATQQNPIHIWRKNEKERDREVDEGRKEEGGQDKGKEVNRQSTQKAYIVLFYYYGHGKR